MHKLPDARVSPVVLPVNTLPGAERFRPERQSLENFFVKSWLACRTHLRASPEYVPVSILFLSHAHADLGELLIDGMNAGGRATKLLRPPAYEQLQAQF
jgi:hypothetical protein